MPWQEPKLDWVSNPINPTSADFNRIEGNIDAVKADIETKKGAIVNAINSKGQTVTLADTYDILASKIQAIFTDGNAIAGDALLGKNFYSGGTKKTGTIPSKGSATITPSTVNQTIAAGQYLSGIQTILGDADLVPSKILKNANIFNVIGTVEPRMFASGTATTSSDTVAYFQATDGGSTSTAPYIIVAGLTFTPKFIFAYDEVNSEWSFFNGIITMFGDYLMQTSLPGTTRVQRYVEGCSLSANVPTNRLWVNATGFKMIHSTTGYTAQSVQWFAFG